MDCTIPHRAGGAGRSGQALCVLPFCVCARPTHRLSWVPFAAAKARSIAKISKYLQMYTYSEPLLGARIRHLRVLDMLRHVYYSCMWRDTAAAQAERRYFHRPDRHGALQLALAQAGRSANGPAARSPRWHCAIQRGAICIRGRRRAAAAAVTAPVLQLVGGRLLPLVARRAGGPAPQHIRPGGLLPRLQRAPEVPGVVALCSGQILRPVRKRSAGPIPVQAGHVVQPKPAAGSAAGAAVSA
eukprot:SAG22_NODE_621_length_8504_cov_3.476859_7_plen_241_part_01